MSVVGVRLGPAQAQIMGYLFQALIDAAGPGIGDVLWFTAWHEFVESCESPEAVVAGVTAILEEHYAEHPEKRPTKEELEAVSMPIFKLPRSHARR